MGGLPTCPPNSDTVEDDDDLYDCVEAEGDDGDDIYEDLMRVEVPPSAVSAAPTNPGCGVPICGVAVSPPLPPNEDMGVPHRGWRWTGGSAAFRSCGRRRRNTLSGTDGRDSLHAPGW